MTVTAMHNLQTLLTDKANRIRALEEKAHTALHKQSDEPAYREIMRQKATLLASLHGTCLPALALLPDSPAKETVSQRLEQFSESASTALHLDSVFYMSALLYPENHVPGTPNDLELFVDSLGDFSF